MVRVKEILRGKRSFLNKNWFIFFTITVYLFFTIYYMGLGTTVLDCGGTLNGLGDNSAGPIWKAANVGDQPIGGYSKVTNYPEGEALSSPVDTVVVGQSVLLWSTSKLAGPVCGYNLANAIGYLSSAFVMFGFIFALTKGRRWIALLAGYVVAFTPFFQAKIGGHPSYGFQGLLIGVLWAFFSLVTTKKKSRALILAALVALCFYFDPYFSLMVMTILLPLTFVWLIVRFRHVKKNPLNRSLFISQLKALALSVVSFVALIAPIAYTTVTQSAAIKSATAGTRENILLEARVYSNFPSEYLLPFKDSPLFAAFGSYEQQIKNSWYAFSNGNVSEDSVGLSLAAVAVVTLFLTIILWERLQRRKLNISKLIRFEPRVVVFGAVAVGVMGFLIALPPIHIFGVPLPSLILIKLTSTWRVLSREYVIVNIALTVLFSVALVYFTHSLRLKRAAKAVSYVLLFLLIFVQYQTYGPFQGLESAKFSYSNSPAGYTWLKEQLSIKAIAEYPIEKATEANSHGYYLSMQTVHKKALLNSAIGNGPGEGVRSSIKNLSDPQTVPTLHTLGINAISVHGVAAAEVEEIPYLTVIYEGIHGVDAGMPGSTAVTKDVMVIAKIDDDAPMPTTSVQFLTTPLLNSTIQTSSITWQYEVSTQTKLALRQLPPKKDGDAVQDQVCFMARMSGEGDAGKLTISGKDGVIFETLLNNEYQPVRFMTDTNQEITLVSSNGNNMRITRIGCNT